MLYLIKLMIHRLKHVEQIKKRIKFFWHIVSIPRQVFLPISQNESGKKEKRTLDRKKEKISFKKEKIGKSR